MNFMKISDVTRRLTSRLSGPSLNRAGGAPPRDHFAHSAPLRFPGDGGARGGTHATARRRSQADVAWGPVRPRAAAARLSPELVRLRVENLAEGWGAAPRREPPHREPTHGTQGPEVVFGVAPCLLALLQGRRVLKRLCVKQGVGSQRESVQRVCEEARRLGVPIRRCSRAQLDAMSGRRVHQGLCLEATPLGFLSDGGDMEPQQQRGTEPPLWLVLDGIQDPMNLGAILRSAYFLGVDRVASSLRNSCPLTPVVSKASSGVMEIMGVYGYESLAHLLTEKARQGWQVLGSVGTENKDAGVPLLDCAEIRLSRPMLLLMGGEGGGLSPELLPLCHALVTIRPHHQLHPAVESLNVSVATGILLHSLLASRRRPHG